MRASNRRKGSAFAVYFRRDIQADEQRDYRPPRHPLLVVTAVVVARLASTRKNVAGCGSKALRAKHFFRRESVSLTFLKFAFLFDLRTWLRHKQLQSLTYISTFHKEERTTHYRLITIVAANTCNATRFAASFSVFNPFFPLVFLSLCFVSF